MREDLRCAIHFSGVVGRRYSVSAHPLSRPSRCTNSVRSTTNGNAQTSGANKTVNGYLIFILYSVALLARALSSSMRSWLFLMVALLFFSCSLYRVDDVYDRPAVRRRVRSREKLEFRGSREVAIDYRLLYLVVWTDGFPRL